MNPQQKANFTKMKSQKNHLSESGGQEDAFDIQNRHVKKKGVKSQHNVKVSKNTPNNDGIFVGTKTIDSGEEIVPEVVKQSNEVRRGGNATPAVIV